MVKGQNLWSAKLRSLVTCLCLVPLHHLSLNLVAVGLKEGKIHLYHGRHVVDYISVTDTPSVVAFGQLEQEENVMVVVSLGMQQTFVFFVAKFWAIIQI
ncbi:hypothetical protein NQ318_008687 [Aromia moschata]|uniref:Uncharacterized protein n=1 Tax=Aromia moschata TaxID=1265417 RepID=A0AAV8XKI8_9CUCU|nr:hypothetical protein NQ318_008687 [Aromia moschata]